MLFPRWNKEKVRLEKEKGRKEVREEGRGKGRETEGHLKTTFNENYVFDIHYSIDSITDLLPFAMRGISILITFLS